MEKQIYETVEQYINAAKPEHQAYLRHLQALIKEHFPESHEVISYQIPTVKFGTKTVLCYASFAKHLSLFGLPKKSFAEQLSRFKTSAGTIQFTLENPIEDGLVIELIKAGVAQMLLSKSK